MFPRKPSKPSKSLTLAQYEAARAAEERLARTEETLARIERAATSRVWDDSRNWR